MVCDLSWPQWSVEPSHKIEMSERTLQILLEQCYSAGRDFAPKEIFAVSGDLFGWFGVNGILCSFWGVEDLFNVVLLMLEH